MPGLGPQEHYLALIVDALDTVRDCLAKHLSVRLQLAGGQNWKDEVIARLNAKARENKNANRSRHIQEAADAVREAGDDLGTADFRLLANISLTLADDLFDREAVGECRGRLSDLRACRNRIAHRGDPTQRSLNYNDPVHVTHIAALLLEKLGCSGEAESLRLQRDSLMEQFQDLRRKTLAGLDFDLEFQLVVLRQALLQGDEGTKRHACRAALALEARAAPLSDALARWAVEAAEKRIDSARDEAVDALKDMGLPAMWGVLDEYERQEATPKGVGCQLLIYVLRDLAGNERSRSLASALPSIIRSLPALTKLIGSFAGTAATELLVEVADSSMDELIAVDGGATILTEKEQRGLLGEGWDAGQEEEVVIHKEVVFDSAHLDSPAGLEPPSPGQRWFTDTRYFKVSSLLEEIGSAAEEALGLLALEPWSGVYQEEDWSEGALQMLKEIKERVESWRADRQDETPPNA